MEPIAQQVPGYFVWSPPGSSVVVHLHLDVIDRLGAEVMRGFGAVPKRGAEVGGVLIGTVQPGSPVIIRVEDFEEVPCLYKRGPSYLLTEEEHPNFEATLDRWRRDGSRPTYAIGYFRSDTRDGMRLAGEDFDLLDACFPSASAIALLIKPYATKVSVAGFFVREDGRFPPETPLEFPFRRRELTGEAPPPRRSLHERRQRPSGGAATALAPSIGPEEPAYFPQPEPLRAAEPAYVTTSPLRPRKRTWVWLPLSFIFLLLGVLLGFQAALMMYPGFAKNEASDLALELDAVRNGDSLTVRWNREAAAVRNAQRGELHISDGGTALTEPVQLSRADLQTGSVVYQNTSPAVRFQLVIYLNNKLVVVETLDWHQ